MKGTKEIVFVMRSALEKSSDFLRNGDFNANC